MARLARCSGERCVEPAVTTFHPHDPSGVGRPTASVSLDGTPRHLHPRVRVQWAIQRSVLFFLLTVIVAAICFVAKAPTAGGAVLGVGLACVLIAVVSASLSWQCWTWSAWEDALELRHGVIVRHSSLVPYHRIQQIDVHREPLQRFLGVSTLILRSAAASTDARIPGIAVTETDPLRHALLARAGVDDAV